MRIQRMLWAAGAVVGAAGVATAQPVAYPGVVASPGVQMVVGPGCAATNQGSYGPAAFSRNPKVHFALNGCEPYCVGRSSYPLSDWAYIRRFCGPTLIPGSCYGHFQTKWRKWEDHCPGGAGCPAPCPTAVAAAPVVPYEPAPARPAFVPQPPPAATIPTAPVTPVDPLKLPPIPKSNDVRALPPEPKAISTIIPQPMPATEPPVKLPEVVLTNPERLVVPPLPELPTRK